MYSLWDRIKSGIYEVVKSRIFVVIIVFCIMSAVLLQRLFYLQIVKGQDYFDDYKLQIQKTKEVQGTRGRSMTAMASSWLTMNWPTRLRLKTTEIMTASSRKIKN